MHINNKDKPLIFIGSSQAMRKYVDVCDELGIKVHGIIDKDYWGNTETYDNIPVIDTEESFDDTGKLEYYKSNFNFFCATNWNPMPDNISVRNKEKRLYLINLIDQLNLPCISLVDERLSRISKTASIGKGVWIDALTVIEPYATIEDYVNVYELVSIGHHSIIGRNTMLGKDSAICGELIIKENVYIATSSKLLKPNSTLGAGTFVQEGIYLRRGTVANEVVSMTGTNTKRVVSYLQDENNSN